MSRPGRGDEWDGDGRVTRDLERRVEASRAELRYTLECLREKLTPERLLGEVMEAGLGLTERAVARSIDDLRKRPLSAFVVAAGGVLALAFRRAGELERERETERWRHEYDELRASNRDDRGEVAERFPPRLTDRWLLLAGLAFTGGGVLSALLQVKARSGGRGKGAAERAPPPDAECRTGADPGSTGAGVAASPGASFTRASAPERSTYRGGSVGSPWGDKAVPREGTPRTDLGIREDEFAQGLKEVEGGGHLPDLRRQRKRTPR